MKLTLYIDPVTGEQITEPEYADGRWGERHAPFGWVPALEIEHEVYWYHGGQLGWKIRLAINEWWQKAPERAWAAIYADWSEYGWPVPRKPVTAASITKALEKGWIKPMQAALEMETSALVNILRRDYNRQHYGAPLPRAEQRRWGWWAV